MLKRLSVCLTIVLLLGADPAKDDLQKMQGDWKVEKAQRGGESPKADELEKLWVRVKGNKMSIDDGSARDEAARITLDPDKKPAAIDIKLLRDDTTLKGIYKFAGETLTICWDKEGDRPTEFVSKADTKQMLFVMKRKK